MRTPTPTFGQSGGTHKRRAGLTPTPMHAQSFETTVDIAPDTAASQKRNRDETLAGGQQSVHWCRGFTLVEVLLVIGILAVLASIVIVAINPARQLADARDAERLSDVYAIMNALHQYAADNDGVFPENATTTEYEICRTGALSCVGLADLSVLTDNESYLVSMPQDPLCDVSDGYCDENGVGYQISKSVNGRMSVSADGAENTTISITR